VKPDVVLVDVGMSLFERIGCSSTVEEANAKTKADFPYYES
jgi:hypothetical protein